MYLIVAHVKPTKKSEKFGELIGAYASVLIDFAEINGAYALAEFYIKEADWEVIEIEEKCLLINSIDEMEVEYKQYYDQVIKNGYCLIFNTYEINDEIE